MTEARGPKKGMRLASWHRLAGLVLVVPLLVWIVTGLVFLIKPGYGDAYAQLEVKTYPMVLERKTIEIPDETLEMRAIRTIVGDHLLVRDDQGWQQWDPEKGVTIKFNEDEARLIVEDSISVDTQRYGQVTSQLGTEFETSTGVSLRFDGNRLSLYQRGKDTDLIDGLYRLHYLQWTGIAWIDRLLAVGCLTILLVLIVLGIRLARNYSGLRSSESG